MPILKNSVYTFFAAIATKICWDVFQWMRSLSHSGPIGTLWYYALVATTVVALIFFALLTFMFFAGIFVDHDEYEAEDGYTTYDNFH